MPLRALVLDLGNVVLDLDFRKMLDAVGLAHGTSEHASMEGLDRMPLFDAFERGSLDEKAFVEAVQPHLKAPLSFSAFETAWNTIFLGEIAGIDATLAKIAARLPLYALSNVNPMHMRRVNQFPAMKRFHRVFTSFELRARKPEPEIYRRVESAVGAARADILYLDDREENVEGARAVGWNAAQVVRSASAIVEHLSRHGVVL